MADNTKQLSQVTITDNSGKTTSAHFAADIDDFMVYTTDATAHSVKKLVFGTTPPNEFITKGDMWTQLKTQADACQKILTDNASFWDGLSKAHYKDPTDNDNYTMKYLATGDDVNKVSFYGNDIITDQSNKDKLVSLGALEDFAKQIPTMGNPNNLAEGNGVAFGDQAKAASNSFAFSGDAEGSNTISFHSQTNEANNVIAFRSQVDSDGAVAFDGQVWGADGIAIKGKVSADKGIAIKGTVSADEGIAIGSGTEASVTNQTVIGHYNIPDPNASFILGTGTNTYNRKNAMKVVNNTLCLPTIPSNKEQTLQVGSYFFLPDENEFLFGGKIELRLTTADLTSNFYSIELPILNSFGGQSHIANDAQSATIRMELNTRTYLYAKINYSQTDGVLVINTAELAFEDKRDGKVWFEDKVSIKIIIKEKMSIKFYPSNEGLDIKS